MNKTKLILLAACVSMTVFGCARGSLLDSDMSQADALLSIDKEAIEVEAASFYEEEYITDSFIVTASRSWSLAAVPEASWLSISQTSGMNLGKVKKNWPVDITFTDNTDPNERNLDLSITIDGERVLLPVTQKAFVPVLELESPATHNLPEVGGEVTLNVRCNTSWTAQVAESSSADVTFSNGEEEIQGTKSGSLTLKVEANTDVKSGKEASIIISTDGAEDVTVSLTQDICIPRLSVNPELSETDVLPVAGQSEFVFETNETWTATVDEVGAASGVTLSAEEGGPKDQLFVQFPDATLEGASATVTITTPSGLSESLTFTQRGCIFISFRTWPDNNGWGSTEKKSLFNWESGKYDIPRYSTPKADGTSFEENPLTTWIEKDNNGYKYTFFVGEDESKLLNSNHSGLVIGSITQNPAFYMEFPAIEGKTLKEVKVMLGNTVKLTNSEDTATGTCGWVTDADGSIVAGGAAQNVVKYQKTDEWQPNEKGQLVQPSFYLDHKNHQESMFHFILTDTQPNTAYRYTGDYRQVIRWFILYYE